MSNDRTNYVRNTPAPEFAAAEREKELKERPTVGVAGITQFNPNLPSSPAPGAVPPAAVTPGSGAPHTVFVSNASATGRNPAVGSAGEGVTIPNGDSVPVLDSRGVRFSGERMVVGLLLAVDRTGAFALYEGTNRVGRRETADYRLHVQIPDAGVSLKQGSINCADGEFVLRTAGDETNPTKLNGKAVIRESVDLRVGDVLTFGGRSYELLAFPAANP